MNKFEKNNSWASKYWVGTMAFVTLSLLRMWHLSLTQNQDSSHSLIEEDRPYKKSMGSIGDNVIPSLQLSRSQVYEVENCLEDVQGNVLNKRGLIPEEVTPTNCSLPFGKSWIGVNI